MTDQTGPAPSEPTAHVIFTLEVDDDGWPPVASERVWAYDLGADRYRVNNVPWFVHDVAIGDVVHAVTPDSDSHPVFTHVIERSEHVTVRVICFRAGPLEGDLQRVVDAFAPLGVYAEGAEQYGMVALDIPPTAPLALVGARLRAGVHDGSWTYEEGRITPAWAAANP